MKLLAHIAAAWLGVCTCDDWTADELCDRIDTALADSCNGPEDET